MKIQNLGTGKYAAFDNVRARTGNAYEQIASGSDYRKNAVHRNHDHDSGRNRNFSGGFDWKTSFLVGSYRMFPPAGPDGTSK
jgi:hypothetical protein